MDDDIGLDRPVREGIEDLNSDNSVIDEEETPADINEDGDATSEEEKEAGGSQGKGGGDSETRS